MLSKLMSSYWWVLLLRGVVAILFGLAAYAWPGLTLVMLVTLFGAFAFADGLFDAIQALGGRKEHEHWWVMLLEGLLGIFVGLVALTAPGITAAVLVLYIGFWAIATGALRIVLAVRLRKEIEGEWWMVLAGLVNIAFGVMVVAQPGTGALALLWLIATWAVVGGVLLVLLSFKVKGLAGKLGELRQPVQARGAVRS